LKEKNAESQTRMPFGKGKVKVLANADTAA